MLRGYLIAIDLFAWTCVAIVLGWWVPAAIMAPLVIFAFVKLWRMRAEEQMLGIPERDDPSALAPNDRRFLPRRTGAQGGTRW